MYQYAPAPKQALLKGLGSQFEALHLHGNSEDEVNKAHKWGMENLRPLMWGMSYDQLMSVHSQVYPDKSELGIFKANLFNELLASTGTSASALAIKAIIEGKKYDNCRDAARILIAVPYHILR